MPSIAIDGPSGAGKSVISDLVSDRLNMVHLDSGAMYRAVGLHMMNASVDLTLPQAIVSELPLVRLDLVFPEGHQHVILDGADVTDQLPGCSFAASKVGTIPQVRAFVDAIIRKIAHSQRVLVNGRDIGTTVLPDADLKIYLTADARVRAQRRHLQLNDSTQTVEQIYQDILARDWQDTHRAISPLARAHDAVEVDGTHITIEQVVTEIVRLARRAGI